MTACKEIKKLLTAYAAGETCLAETQQVEEHLKVCPACMAEYHIQQRIVENMEYFNQECEVVMQSIDWEESARLISRSARSRFLSPARRFSFSFNLSNWKVLVPIAAAVLVLGMWLGYLLFHTPRGQQFFQTGAGVSHSPLRRLETTLATREVSSYFKQTQMVLTDLMGQCEPEGVISWQRQLNRERVKALLSKSRYFEQNLDSPRLLSTRALLKKIEWLLYEILAMEGEVSCDQLQRIQEYIRQERLLFKIQLIEKDVAHSEV